MAGVKNHWTLMVALIVFREILQVECFYKAQMPKGFRLSPNSDSEGKGEFQSILFSPNGDFALGFYIAEENNLLLSVAYAAEMKEIVWSANRNDTVAADCVFMQDSSGSVALVDTRGRDVWRVDVQAEAVLALLDTGNLQLQGKEKVEWQSFDHPTDTLLEGQNFTASMKLTAAGEAYSLQMEAAGMALRWNSDQVYWRRAAMQEKAQIVPGKGQIYARLEPDGYIAMYQSESQLVDVNPLDTYRRKLGIATRLKIDGDGNLRCYYWRNESGVWEVDFQAVKSSCNLPNFCGAYGFCTFENRCTCLTADGAAGCLHLPAPGSNPAEFCGGAATAARITGVDLPYAQFVDFVSVESEKACVDLCGSECGCAAAVFYNNSKRCYQVPAAVPTLLQVAARDKVGFIKVVNETVSEKASKGKGVKILGFAAVVVGGLALVIGCAIIIWRCKLQCAKKEVNIEMSQKFMASWPYKDLKKELGA